MRNWAASMAAKIAAAEDAAGAPTDTGTGRPQGAPDSSSTTCSPPPSLAQWVFNAGATAQGTELSSPLALSPMDEALPELAQSVLRAGSVARSTGSSSNPASPHMGEPLPEPREAPADQLTCMLAARSRDRTQKCYSLSELLGSVDLGQGLGHTGALVNGPSLASAADPRVCFLDLSASPTFSDPWPATTADARCPFDLSGPDAQALCKNQRAGSRGWMQKWCARADIRCLGPAEAKAARAPVLSMLEGSSVLLTLCALMMAASVP